MDIIISARHMNHVSERMRSELEGRLERVAQKYGKLTKAEVVFDKVRDKYAVEIVLHGKGINIDAKSSGADNLYEALHQASDRLDKQLDKKAGKMKRHNSTHLGNLELEFVVRTEEEMEMETEFDAVSAF
ncbi:MAG: ribosome-associated translation inhibitor RaiA [Lentisphaeraceae bacterium]|nr:ribosome-associated translation inhibitor RaiA [Lentisphaeraceae bacterium]